MEQQRGSQCRAGRCCPTAIVLWGVSILAWLGWLSSFGMGQQIKEATDTSYVDSIKTWRAEHEAKFRSPTGWLALTGHYWLKQGENRIGNTSSETVRLPVDLDKSISASIYLIGDVAELQVPKSVPITVNGESVEQARLPMESDEVEADCKDVIRVADRVVLQLVRRVGKLAIRVRDSQSELLKNFKGKNWFDVDPQYCVTAKFVRRAQPLIEKIKNIKGDSIESKFSGIIEFELQGNKYQLDAIPEGNSLFVIFKDKTNGESTYPAGRFLDVELPESGDLITLDFNKAYQPPCAFSPHTLCPLPPKRNYLEVMIPAGEKRIGH